MSKTLNEMKNEMQLDWSGNELTYEEHSLAKAVNPSHYKQNGIETIDYMKAISTKEEYRGHLKLTAIKYLSRLGKKDNELQEASKCLWYVEKLVESYRG
jgi:Protein of unknwon function (DUF3310)